jgi:hypothetical protein
VLTIQPPPSFAAQWWPATLQGPLPTAAEAAPAAAPPATGAEPAAAAEPAPRAADGEGRVGYALLYDADAGAGHDDPAPARVTFLSEHELYDLGEDEVLSWRRAGAAWEPAPQHRLAGVPAAVRPAPGGRAGAAGVAVRLDDVAAALRRGERLRGASGDAELGALLGALPPALARGAADGFSRLTSAVADGLRRLHEEHGEEYVVQEGDIAAILARVDPNLAERVKRQRRG